MACSLPSTQLLIVFSVPFTVMSLNVWLQLCQSPFSSVSVLAVLVQDINTACVRQSCAAQRKQPKRQHWRNKTSQEHLQQSLRPSQDAKQLQQIKTILDSCKFTTVGMGRRAKRTPLYQQQSLWCMPYSTSRQGRAVALHKPRDAAAKSKRQVPTWQLLHGNYQVEMLLPPRQIWDSLPHFHWGLKLPQNYSL